MSYSTKFLRVLIANHDFILSLQIQAIKDGMDAREIESLSMLARGFVDLKEANPQLAYSVILDILAGINEYVNHHFPTSHGDGD